MRRKSLGKVILASKSVRKCAGRSFLILFEERLSPSFSTDLNEEYNMNTFGVYTPVRDCESLGFAKKKKKRQSIIL